MMADWRYTVSTENSFTGLCEEEMAREQTMQTMQTMKRKRQNTGQDGSGLSSELSSAFMNSSVDDKLNFIFEELRYVRINQEQMSKGMLTFHEQFQAVNNKIETVINVANKSTNLLKTLAYKSIDQEARAR